MSNKESLSELNFTICPVLVASHVAVAKGWLDEELAKVGTKSRYLYSRPATDWLAHFTHELPDLIRDGGNSPAIWAKANGVETKLIGLTFSRSAGKIISRPDSGIYALSGLKGKKIGLSKRIQDDRIDFWRATSHRGILVALEIGGVNRKDVEIVDIAADDLHDDHGPINTPAEKWTKYGSKSHLNPEVQALLEGKVDAIYVNYGAFENLEEEGKIKVVDDLDRYPDWTLRIANGPSTITVNADLANNHPEVVVAYLKAVVRTGKWINEHPDEAAEVYAQVSTIRDAKKAAIELRKYNLVPSLSGKNIKAIEIEKKHLVDEGYLEKDFDLSSWVDSSFLEEALKN